MSPLFIVLEEAHGQFGPKVMKTLFKPENIYVEASAPGKLSKELFQIWIQNVVLLHSGNSPILLLDSWSGQCENAVKEALPKESNLILKTIPKGIPKGYSLLMYMVFDYGKTL